MAQYIPSTLRFNHLALIYSVEIFYQLSVSPVFPTFYELFVLAAEKFNKPKPRKTTKVQKICRQTIFQ